MPYNKDATKTVLDLIGLASGSQQIADLWLALWDGCHLPNADVFRPARLGPLGAFALFQHVRPDESIKIRHCGTQLARWVGEDLTDSDWIARALPRFRPERMRRSSAVARGAIMRATRQIMDEERPHAVETICLPLSPEPDGSVTVVQFVAPPPGNHDGAALRGLVEEAETVEFIPVIANPPPSQSGRNAGTALKPEERIKIISRATIRFLLGVCADTLAAYPKIELDPIDLLLASLIGSANTSHIENDPELRRQYAGLIEPDWTRRGISRAAAARAMALPFETTRRRINRMIELGVLLERPDGIILSESNPYGLDSNTARMSVHAHLTERFWKELKARGVVFA